MDHMDMTPTDTMGIKLFILDILHLLVWSALYNIYWELNIVVQCFMFVAQSYHCYVYVGKFRLQKHQSQSNEA